MTAGKTQLRQWQCRYQPENILRWPPETCRIPCGHDGGAAIGKNRLKRQAGSTERFTIEKFVAENADKPEDRLTRRDAPPRTDQVSHFDSSWSKHCMSAVSVPGSGASGASPPAWRR